MKNKLELFFNSSLTPLKLNGVISMIQTMKSNVLLIGEGNKLCLYNYILSNRELTPLYSLDIKNFPVAYVKDLNMILIADVMESLSLVLYDNNNQCLLNKGYDLNSYFCSSCCFFTDYSNCEGLNAPEFQNKNLLGNSNVQTSFSSLYSMTNNNILGNPLSNNKFSYNFNFNQIPLSLNNTNNTLNSSSTTNKLLPAKCGFLLSDLDDNLHVYLANTENNNGNVYNIFVEVADFNLGQRIVDFYYNDSLKDEYYYATDEGGIGIIKFIEESVFDKIKKISSYMNEMFPWTGSVLPCDFNNVDYCKSYSNYNSSVFGRIKTSKGNIIDYSMIDSFLKLAYQYQNYFSETIENENRIITISSIINVIKNKHLFPSN